jgi:hypothetical protein
MEQTYIYKLAYDTLSEISDECGEEELVEGYLLKFEGWCSICFEEVLIMIEAEQLKRDMDIESREAEDEKMTACYNYAEEKSYLIIENEWKPELERRCYNFIDGGYDKGGLYGITWSLFKKSDY